jgi:hypothetical protein
MRRERHPSGDTTVADFWRFLTVLLIIGTRSALYVGGGFLCYAYFVQERVDWDSAWFYAYLLAWPVILFAKFFLWAVVTIIAIVVLIVAGFWLTEQWDKRRAKHVRARREAERLKRHRIIEH